MTDVEIVDETGSTNADLLARSDVPHGTALRARRQTAGRGRLGRVWVAAEDGLVLSVLLRPVAPPRAWPTLSLLSAVAVAEALGPDVLLKWPNDLVVADGRKLGGILVDADVQRGLVVVGVGVDVGSAPIVGAACLAELGPAPPLDALAASIRRGLLDAAAALSAPESWLDRWRSRSHTLGRRVRVGDRVGVAIDLAADGALRLQLDDGARVDVRAGDVTVEGVRAVLGPPTSGGDP